MQLFSHLFSKVCSELLRFIPAALNLIRETLRSRVSNERKITQTSIFFARRDGWSRPYSYGLRKRILIISRKKSIRPNYSEHNRN